MKAAITMSSLPFIAILVLNTQRIAAQHFATTQPLASVTIHVIDEYGLAVDFAVSSFGTGKREMSSHFNGRQGTQIPYGRYDYLIRRGGSGTVGEIIPGSVSVQWPENLVVVTVERKFIPGVSLDKAIPPRFVIRGKLEPMPPSGEQVWIRLGSVHQKNQLDVMVDPSGEFHIYEPLEGRYILTVIQGQEVLHVQQVSFDENWRPANFMVKLPEQHPSILHVLRK